MRKIKIVADSSADLLQLEGMDFAVAPLNLLKGILISVPTMVLYKRISKALHNGAERNALLPAPPPVQRAW